MTQENNQPKIIDSVVDPVKGTNMEIGWGGNKLFYRPISNKKEVKWKELKLVIAYPERICAISNMLVRSGYDW